MLILYNLFLTLTFPFWVPWMLFRAWRRKEKPIWKERFGDFELLPDRGQIRVWVHAVSVGEVKAAMPILERLRAAPEGIKIVLTTTTSSGHRTAIENASGLYDHLFYCPIDVVRFAVAAMQRVRPAVLAVMETELWPNLLWAANAHGSTTMLINGRISDRSYPRSMRIRFFYRWILGHVDRCLMQTQVDAERIRNLGAKSAEVIGNAKFDQAIEEAHASSRDWRKELGIPGEKPLLVIGSTRGSEEEDLVIAAVELVGLGRIAVVHAPRHLERVPDLAEKIKTRFGSVALRSKLQHADYTILDTYGELADLYSAADIVIVGGGFENLGGQNLLQPLAHGKPVLHGPHMQNFREAAKGADECGSAVVCGSASELAERILQLLDNESLRQQMGHAAFTFVSAHVGAADRYAEAILGSIRSRKKPA